MGDVSVKSIGMLLDELITTNIKCFFALEQAEEARLLQEEGDVAYHYGRAQQLNSRRSALIQAIDKRLGESDITLTDKTYG